MKPLIIIADQDRGEHDSASRADLVRKCRGRWALVRHLREKGDLYEELLDEDAELGTLIHVRLCGVDVILPEGRAENTYQMCRKLRDRMVSSFTGGKVTIPEVGCPEERQDRGRYQVLLEMRLWYRVGLTKLFSGQGDLIVIDLEEARALIIDYKSGMGEVDLPASNKQLRALEVLLKHNAPGLESIDCEILQPWAGWDPHPVQYTAANFKEAEEEIVQIYSEALYDKRRAAGEHCRLCEARAQCATALRYVNDANSLCRGIEDGRIVLPPGAKGDSALDQIETVEKILGAVKARYKAELIKDAGFLPGRHITDGNRSVSSVAAAWQIAKIVLDRPQFDAACSVKLTELEEALSAELGWRAKEKKQRFNEMFADILERGEPKMMKLSAKERKAREAVAQLEAPAIQEEAPVTQ
jgi:hypothetical protein